ncbi:unnamed protein product [Orchesella dallaii]|uniref:Post-GPI attachment to proteins factor 3 n=1 Tax=Orchesella dallaii TaxID=48710 RepID=A0ABP1PPP9_9HEXA
MNMKMGASWATSGSSCYFGSRVVINRKLGSFPVLLVLFLCLCVFPSSVRPSRGDRDYTFHNCLIKCKQSSCVGKDYIGQPDYLKYLSWDCDSECKYQCMWQTVHTFQMHNIPIPQFFGKWPFIRLWGVQEPASTVFSLVNLLSHVFGIWHLRKNVPKDAPLIPLWYLFAAVCINGWVWSIVFHTRDFPVTELMDYFSAFSMNAFSFFSVFVRLFQKWMCWPVMTMGVLILSFCAYHVHYLTFVHFDYGYNMKANIAMGVLNASCWLTWSGVNRRSLHHVWKCALFVLLAVASLVMEVFDFPPIFWVIDAHALWHLFTGPLTLLWYSFLVDDCRYLYEEEKEKQKLM